MQAILRTVYRSSSFDVCHLPASWQLTNGKSPSVAYRGRRRVRVLKAASRESRPATELNLNV